jgi:uncharacterized protein (TIGR00369 family)
MTASPPEGFIAHARKSPLTDPWEPIYARQTHDRLVLGVYVRPEHTNSRGMAHGGLIAALADNAMGLSCGVAARAAGREIGGLVTASLHVDYMGRAELGQWLEFTSTFIKLGKALCFTDLMVTADGKPVAKASATFAVAG